MKKKTEDFKSMKGNAPIAMLTAYSCPVAMALEQAAIPILLVGDSLGMVELGFASTREVTIEHMVHHTAAVRRGAPQTYIVSDLPYGTDTTPASALGHAQQLCQAGADAVKLEGAKCDVIRHLTAHGIPVVGHAGLLPQTAKRFNKVGNSPDEARQLLDDAKAIEKAGAFMLVLEHIPAALAQELTRQLSIPTIGIGAGPFCDGQVLVVNDMLGLGKRWPPFSKQYLRGGQLIEEAAKNYLHEVTARQFPPADHSEKPADSVEHPYESN